MGPDPIHALVLEDQQLTVGAEVTVYWTEGGFDYRGWGQIIGLTSTRARVFLSSASGNHPPYSSTKIVEVARITDPSSWSSQKCVRLGKQLPRVA